MAIVGASRERDEPNQGDGSKKDIFHGRDTLGPFLKVDKDSGPPQPADAVEGLNARDAGGVERSMTRIVATWLAFGFLATLLPAAPPTADTSWHQGIATTVFWMDPGAKPAGPRSLNAPSGNLDLTEARDAHAAPANPFYVALPFDDLKHPDLAEQWVPASWRSKESGSGSSPWQSVHTRTGTVQARWEKTSACLGRWVELRNATGRVCFARWMDVGPIRDDDAPYVLGRALPQESRGLDVSPAVSQYLGVRNLDQVSWRFVDEKDVLKGQWWRSSDWLYAHPTTAPAPGAPAI